MVFDKIFIPSHVSVNHIKMGSWTAKSYHGLFIVSWQITDDPLPVELPQCKWTAVKWKWTVFFYIGQFQNSALSLGVNGFILK